jgi:hypothetical protein
VGPAERRDLKESALAARLGRLLGNELLLVALCKSAASRAETGSAPGPLPEHVSSLARLLDRVFFAGLEVPVVGILDSAPFARSADASLWFRRVPAEADRCATLLLSSCVADMLLKGRPFPLKLGPRVEAALSVITG